MNQTDTYQADLANYRDIAAHVGGYVYESGTGHIMWSCDPMTEEELREHWEYIEESSLLFETHSEEYDYDSADDGYGWERRALARRI